MTNREWLESLSNEELAEWLCDNLYLKTIEGIPIYSGINAVKSSYIHSQLGVLDWLGKEKQNDS